VSLRGIKLREKLKWRKMRLVLVGLGGAGGAIGLGSWKWYSPRLSCSSGHLEHSSLQQLREIRGRIREQHQTLPFGITCKIPTFKNKAKGKAKVLMPGKFHSIFVNYMILCSKHHQFADIFNPIYLKKQSLYPEV
jgi:hypothetical protein